jgi:hypothetical protein
MIHSGWDFHPRGIHEGFEPRRHHWQEGFNICFTGLAAFFYFSYSLIKIIILKLKGGAGRL